MSLSIQLSLSLHLDPKPSQWGTAPSYPRVYQMKRERNDHAEHLGQSRWRDLGPEHNLRPCNWIVWIQAGKERALNLNRIGVKIGSINVRCDDFRQ